MKLRIFLISVNIVVLIALLFVGGIFYINYFGENQAVAALNTSTSQTDTADNTLSNVDVTTGDNTTSVTPANTTPDTKTDTTSDTEKIEEPIRIIAMGDILLGRTVKKRVEIKASRYLFPFEKVVDLLNKGDIIFGNLEESITASTKSLTGIDQDGKYVLKNEPEALNGIKYAGFNLLSLANNHILDYYEQGLFDTLDTLDRNNIAHAGAGRNLDEARKLAVIEKKGLKIGLLAYTDMADILYKGNPTLRFAAKADKSGVAPSKREYILDDIAKARAGVDILIVSLHWGVEYSYEPKEEQVKLAHEIIDSGADVLIGHHTHRCQGVEIYKDKPIFYSLGNFIFDQNDPLNQQSFFFDMEIKDRKLSALSGIPIKTEDKSQIVPQTAQNGMEQLKREMELSTKLGSKCHIDAGKLIFELQ